MKITGVTAPAIATIILAWCFFAVGCTSTRTVSENVETGARQLKLKAGDTVKVVTIYRQRYFIKVTKIEEDGFQGITLRWSGSSAPPDQPVFIDYAKLALIQEEHFSKGKTAGAVATVTIVGAMVAAVAVAGPPAVMPPPQ